MSKQSQKEKAEALLALHHSGEMLILPNVWSPIGARVLQAKGYPAVATASAALSASLGYEDGERIKRSTLIEFLGRIAGCVDVPVTADIERGYGASLAELEETAGQVMHAGMVGINLEDSIDERKGALRPMAEQCARISAVRKIGERRNIHLVINARVDCFLSPLFPDKAKALEETVSRAIAYSEAGADCIYPIGPGDERTVGILRERIKLPINILASPNAVPLSTLRRLGVNRVSFGPFVFRSCLGQFVKIAETLRADGDYGCLGNVPSGGQVAEYLVRDPED
jgi:2-methylisocitrate lyase-like PEP mutase family enzyme